MFVMRPTGALNRALRSASFSVLLCIAVHSTLSNSSSLGGRENVQIAYSTCRGFLLGDYQGTWRFFSN